MNKNLFFSDEIMIRHNLRKNQKESNSNCLVSGLLMGPRPRTQTAIAHATDVRTSYRTRASLKKVKICPQLDSGWTTYFPKIY